MRKIEPQEQREACLRSSCCELQSWIQTHIWQVPILCTLLSITPISQAHFVSTQRSEPNLVLSRKYLLNVIQPRNHHFYVAFLFSINGKSTVTTLPIQTPYDCGINIKTPNRVLYTKPSHSEWDFSSPAIAISERASMTVEGHRTFWTAGLSKADWDALSWLLWSTFLQLQASLLWGALPLKSTRAWNPWENR